MSWNFDSGNDKKNFTKFPVGVTRIRVIDKSPHTRWTHWINSFQKSVNCPGSRECPICQLRQKQKDAKEPQTYGVSRRIAINIYNYDTEKQEIMEQGKTFFEDLRDLHKELSEDGSDLDQAILKVRRRGTGKDDTSYRIDIDEKTSPEDVVIKAREEKTDLVEYFTPHTQEQIQAIISAQPKSKEEANTMWQAIMSGDEDNESSERDEQFEIE